MIQPLHNNRVQFSRFSSQPEGRMRRRFWFVALWGLAIALSAVPAGAGYIYWSEFSVAIVTAVHASPAFHSRKSHARAYFHVRSMVRGLTPRVWAVSSTLRPA